MEAASRPPVAQSAISLVLLGGVPSEASDAALHAWLRWLQKSRRVFELLLVRAERAEGHYPADLGVPAPQLQVFSYRDGWAQALQQALDACQHPLVATCSYDQQYQPDDVGKLLRIIDEVDVVAGYRVTNIAPPGWVSFCDGLTNLAAMLFLGTSLERRKTWLGLEGWGRRFVARWVFGVQVADPECPYRLFRREALTRIPVQSNGEFAHVELLAKANHLACLMAEEPVTWHPAGEKSAASGFGAQAWTIFTSPRFRPPLAPAAP